VGSAFTTPDYYQSNAVIESDDAAGVRRRAFLLDCGGDARHSLKEIGITHRNIDSVYISHLHADHIGGMEWLGFCTYFDPECGKPTLYIVDELVEPLWESLKAGMQSHEGVVLELGSFFNVVSVEINQCFNWRGIQMCPIQTVHVMNGNGIVPSYGLLIEQKGSQEKLFFTTDTQFCPRQIEKFYDMSDVVFHDCETYPFRSGVHAHYDDLVTLPDEQKAKMWLYHYGPNPPQDPVADGFRGFVEKGQSFLF
jgi:ribonuclease BN (tRNA processing enzyme)